MKYDKEKYLQKTQIERVQKGKKKNYISLPLYKVVGQNANRAKCQPDKMPTEGWHLVWTLFCAWHFVHPIFCVAFSPDHLNMFWHFVRIMEFI